MVYSKNSYAREAQGSGLELPARYSGVRFRRDKRSDGRDVVIEAPLRDARDAPENEVSESSPVAKTIPEEKGEERHGYLSGLAGLFGNVGEDDILIAALLIILAGEGREGNREGILLLILLLCIR